MTDIKSLRRQFLNGGIDRRTFMQGAMALGLTPAFATALASTAVAEGTPKKGGNMRFAMGHGDTTDTLDPGQVNNGFLAALHFNCTNMLTEVEADGSLQPKLAESWESSPDATQWTFKLRKGVDFHNGRPVKAVDVIASINHHRGKDSKSAAKPLVAAVEDITADGDNVVIVKLNAGNADFPFTVSDFNFPIYPANDDGSLDFSSRNGCGAYMLKEFEPGQQAHLVRNPNYWNLGKRAHFDTCQLLAVLDVSARQNALVAGDVDGMDRVDLKTADRLANAANVKLEEVSGKTFYTFPMRTDTAPFNNVDVRLAIKNAINRESLLKTILFGHGTLGNDQPISPAYKYYAADIPQRTFDPEKARFHLKKAGLSSLDVKLSAADAAFANAVDAAVLIKAEAAKAGINIEVVRETGDGYWSNVWMKRPWSAAYWFGTPTCDGIFTQAYAAGAAWNDAYWSNDRFNALLIKARAELNDSRRAEMYREMQMIVRDDGGVVAPLFANDVFATSKKVQHGPLANNLEIDGRLFFERWWFA